MFFIQITDCYIKKILLINKYGFLLDLSMTECFTMVIFKFVFLDCYHISLRHFF